MPLARERIREQHMDMVAVARLWVVGGKEPRSSSPHMVNVWQVGMSIPGTTRCSLLLIKGCAWYHITAGTISSIISPND